MTSNRVEVGRPRDATLLLALASIAAGALTAGVSLAGPALVGALLLLYFAVLFWEHPQIAFIGFGFFLIFQDLVVAILASASPELGSVVHRSDDVLIATMFVITLLRGLRPVVSFYVPLSMLVVIAIASSTFGQHVGLIPATFDLFLLVKGFLLFLIAYQIEWKPDDYRLLFRWFGVLCFIMILMGFFDPILPAWQLGMGLTGEIQYRAGLEAVQGAFSHPGVYGQLSMISLLFSLSYSVVRRTKAIYLLSGFFALGALMSLRVAPLASAFVAIVLVLIFIGQGRIVRMATLFVILAVPIAIMFQGPIREVIGTKVSAESTSGARKVLWRTGITISRDYFPLGAGLGTFGGAISRQWYSPLYHRYGISNVYGLTPATSANDSDFTSDTHWPYVLGETGIVGLACYLACIFAIARLLRRKLREQASHIATAISLGALLALSAGVVTAFAAPIFQTSLGGYLTLGAAGTACGGVAARADSKDIVLSRKRL